MHIFPIEPELTKRIQYIKILLLDVDGVLTEGGIVLDDHGVETKRFDVKDGHGIRLLQQAGIRVVFLTGRTSQVVLHRAADLQITEVIQGAQNKKTAYTLFKERTGYTDSDIAYVGDDVVDIPILRQAGVAIAVNDAVEEVKEIADYITSCRGGYGAIREIAELILKTQEHWDRLLEQYWA